MPEPGNEWIKDVTDDDFERVVLEGSRERTVIVDFWAEWCGPCRLLGPVLEKLAAEYQGKFLLAKVNVDASPRQAQAYGVRGIPMVMAFRDGEPVAEFTGALPEHSVRQFIGKVCPGEADELVGRAEAAEVKEPDEAEKLYRRALELDPRHEKAKLGLAERLLARGERGEARALGEDLVPAGELSERIEQLHAQLALQDLHPQASEAELRRKLEEDPENAETLMELAKLFASEKRYPEALETFLKAAESDRKLASGEAKELMVEIFHVVGVRSELADEYRSRLSRLLY